jgi:triosephosphate isomerase
VNKPAHIASNIAVNALRFTLALVFAFSGFVKAIDPMGTVYKLADYSEAFGLDVPFALLSLGAWVLILLEYIIGIALFFGFYRRFYLWLSIIFLSVMTPLTLWLGLTNPISDCGCFGDFLVLTHWQTFGKNVILLAMTIVVLVHRERVLRVVSERMQWLVFVYASLSIVLFMQHNLRHLPAWDFRPYAIGANIVDGMTIPEDAPKDEYETLFVLEKDGEQCTFTIDNYPDSAWNFVRRENRLVSKGYVPPITDFYLSTLEGDDATWEVLDSVGYTFFMVARNLERTNEGILDVVNDLHDYAKVNHVPFYMLTSSNVNVIEEWSEHTGASYPYLNADEILLKTMIRSNTGLVVLKDATIVGKWSASDMPRDSQLDTPIEDNKAFAITPREVRILHISVVLWMFFPLLVLALL